MPHKTLSIVNIMSDNGSGAVGVSNLGFKHRYTGLNPFGSSCGLMYQAAGETGVPSPVSEFSLGTTDSAERVGTADLVSGPGCPDAEGSGYNGIDQWHDFDASSASAAFGSGAFTISIWFKSSSTSTHDLIGTKDGTIADGSWVMRYQNGKINFLLHDVLESTPLDIYKDNEWHLVTASSTGASGIFKMHVDSLEVLNTSSPAHNLIDTTFLKVGVNFNGGARMMDGCLDNAKLHNVALNDYQIQSLFNRCD